MFQNINWFMKICIHIALKKSDLPLIPIYGYGIHRQFNPAASLKHTNIKLARYR